MAEIKQQQVLPFSEEFPPLDVPAIFADGILNLANSPRVAKCYLFRLDPSLSDAGKAQVRPCAQIVMPIDAVVNILAFLESAVENLRVQGIISDQALEIARQAVRGA